ncbi:hypothetical protein NMY22_g10808 [Coprinellus aureogranulatus]|nr:hypothetical protein NMY22_g10808 [Coprinellus aureogranulatus]
MTLALYFHLPCPLFRFPTKSCSWVQEVGNLAPPFNCPGVSSQQHRTYEALLTARLSRSPTLHDVPQSHPAALPYEVLQAIFVTAMEGSTSDVDVVEKDRLRRNILAFSQVCGQWRYAALGYSPLWVHSIDFLSYPSLAIDYYLRLSRPNPIDVGHRSAPFRVAGRRALVVLHILKDDYNRVRQWNIEISPDYRHLNLQHLFGDAEGAISYPVHTFRQAGRMNIPEGPWSQLVSSLEKLSLCDTNLALNSFMEFSHLAELSIKSTYHRSAKYQIMEVIALLRKTPRLRFLRLKDAIRPGPEDNPIAANQPILPVILPDLRLIALSEADWETAYLLLLLIPILQKSERCCVDLSLPSYASRTEDGIPVNEIVAALGSVQENVQGGPFSPSMTAPRVEVALQCRGEHDFQLTMGTVPNPERTLDWNGNSGTVGVTKYLDDYFKTASQARSQARVHPPLSVTLPNPVAQDIRSTACILNASTLYTTGSLRMSVDLPLLTTRSADQVIDTLPSPLINMRRVRTVTLDEGASMVILPTLQGRTFLNADRVPVPWLPNLEFIAIECSRPRVGELGYFGQAVGSDIQLVIRRYVEWRRQVGLPVRVLWSGSVAEGGDPEGKGSDSRRRGGRWKRNGIVSLPGR